jgi:hypothetical protein
VADCAHRDMRLIPQPRFNRLAAHDMPPLTHMCPPPPDQGRRSSSVRHFRGGRRTFECRQAP